MVYKNQICHSSGGWQSEIKARLNTRRGLLSASGMAPITSSNSSFLLHIFLGSWDQTCKWGWVRDTSMPAGNTLHRQEGLCSDDGCPQQDYSQALEIRISESEQVRWEKLIFPSARSCLHVPLTKVVSFTFLFGSDWAPVHSTYLLVAAETHLQTSKLMQALISLPPLP